MTQNEIWAVIYSVILRITVNRHFTPLLTAWVLIQPLVANNGMV